MAEGDEKALSFGDAVNAAFHPDVEFFRFFESVPVFEDIDFGFLIDVVLLDRDLLDDVDEVFVDLGENTVFIEGLGSPEDPLSLVHRSEVFEDHVSHMILSRVPVFLVPYKKRAELPLIFAFFTYGNPANALKLGIVTVSSISH
jgi:hypothetical protein